MNAVARSEPQNTQALKTLASFKSIHEGETILVCGCGESLNELKDQVGAVTIGVNDIGRRLHPDYLVIVNPRSQFTADRFRYVESSQARYLFTQYNDIRTAQPKLIKIKLGKYGGTDFIARVCD